MLDRNTTWHSSTEARSLLSCFSFFLSLSFYLRIALGLWPIITMMGPIELSIQNDPLHNFHWDFLFQDTYFPVLFVCFPFFFFPSIVWNSSFGCVTDFYSNRQGLSSNSDCSIEQYKTHQCCSAESPPMLLDKVSLEKLLSGYAGLLLCFQTGSAVPTSLAKQLEYSTLATSWNEHMPVTH